MIVLVRPCTYKNELNLPVTIYDGIMACAIHKKALLHLLHLPLMVLLDSPHSSTQSHASTVF